MAWTFSETVTS